MDRLTRRKLLRMAAALPVAQSGLTVNDIHSQLNETVVSGVTSVSSLDMLLQAVAEARSRKEAVAIAGGRHAMGGQQFAAGGRLLDTQPLSRVLDFDARRGIVEVEAGIQWPALVGSLLDGQKGRARQWGIAQKQTGADRLSIGGAVAANVHGRGLKMKPFIADVESLVMVDARGETVHCDRGRNSELFRLACGGYGLFGAVYSVKLRLARRQKLERVVELGRSDDLISAFDKRIAAGFLFGDFQFAIDPESDDFLRRGVFSCYQPAPPSAPMPERLREMADDDWARLLHLAHVNKTEAFKQYAGYYLATSGQLYWSDQHQLGPYFDDYHRAVDRATGAASRATEMITEIYVPRPALAAFLDDARADFRKNKVEVIYGTIRLIERDEESFLAWAKQPWACVIFNLHTVHTPEGLEHSSAAFRRLIDLAIRRGGSYYLTYHRWARRDQVEACYPRFREFLRLKKKHDPSELFQSEWYRHYRRMFGEPA